jgi:hypothetical protein
MGAYWHYIVDLPTSRTLIEETGSRPGARLPECDALAIGPVPAINREEQS